MKKLKVVLISIVAMMLGWFAVLALSYDSMGFGLLGAKNGELYLVKGLILNKWLFILVMIYLIWTLWKASKVVTDERNMLFNVVTFIGKWLWIQLQTVFFMGKFAFKAGKGVKGFYDNMKGEQDDEEDEDIILEAEEVLNKDGTPVQ